MENKVTKKYINELTAKAQSGDANCQVELANRYFNGIGVERSFKEAYKWYLSSAIEGNVESEFMVGFCNEHNFGIKGDLEEMVIWYQKASDDGYMKAKYHLGLCYYFGYYFEQDKEKALEYICEASTHDDADAQAFMAHCYTKGDILNKNESLATELYKKARKGGNKIAYHFLKTIYYTQAFTDKELKERVKKGDINAAFMLGERYEIAGVNIPNYRLALKYHTIAAKEGHPGAMYNISKLYSEKKILDKEGNPVKNYGYRMRKLMRIAAAKGYPKAIKWCEDYYISQQILIEEMKEFLLKFTNMTENEQEEYIKKKSKDYENIYEYDEDIEN